MARIVTDFLDKNVEAFPDKVFAGDYQETATYRQLRERALVISHAIGESGYFKQPIAIFMQKTVKCLVSIIGIAYSGCFYTVLDTKGAIDRNKRIIEDLEPVLIITDRCSADALKNINAPVKTLIYEDIIEKKHKETAYINSKKICREDLLCVIYTSGSSGTPKGVAIPHRAVVNYIEDASIGFQNISSDDVFGNQYPFYYVASLEDIFLTLCNGASMYIIPEELFFSPSGLVDYLIEKQINVISWVPSAMELIEKYDAFHGKDVSKIKKVIFGGEVIKPKTLNYWMNEITEAFFINVYGATETTSGTSYYVVERSEDNKENIPLGNSFPGVEMIVIDDNGLQVEQGKQGELYVRSDYMSYGYYGDSEKTERVFVQNPINDKYSETVYKTGDIVEIRGDGNLVFVGRGDKQIKRSGHRINLAEIEKTIKEKIEGVDECICLYQNERNRIEVIYTGKITENDFQGHLQTLFSMAMRPDSVRKINAMPLNANGKIDMNLLSK